MRVAELGRCLFPDEVALYNKSISELVNKSVAEETTRYFKSVAELVGQTDRRQGPQAVSESAVQKLQVLRGILCDVCI